MSFADSILQTASIARCVAWSVTHTNQGMGERLFKSLIVTPAFAGVTIFRYFRAICAFS